MDIISIYWAENYNAIIVTLATIALGLSAGFVGSFLVLRKQALISDAVTHATLPGICIGFFLSLWLGLDNGRFLPLILLCSAVTASLGAFLVQYIARNTRLSFDTAIAAIMSIFYGAGMLLLSVIQNVSAGNKAGLDTFLLGQVSGLAMNDLTLLFYMLVFVIIMSVRHFKNLRLLCFDQNYASLLGLDVKKTERVFLLLMILVICTGLKMVGLIMIVALLIVPPITARLWTDRCDVMVGLSALFGAMSCVIGVVVSSNIYDLPTGATIVLSAFTMFMASLAIHRIRGRVHA